MFHKLNKKYTIVLLSTIMITLLAYSISIYFFYSHLLSDDYYEKFNYFGNQQVTSIEKKLKFAEYNLYDIYPTNASEQNVSDMAIKKSLIHIKNCNLEIENVFLITSEQIYYSSSDDYILCNVLQQLHPQIFDSTADSTQWYYLKYRNEANDALLFLRIQSDDAYPHNYVLGITLPVAAILPSFSSSSDSHFFSVSSFSLKLISNPDCTLLMNDTLTADIPSENQTMEGTFFAEITQTPFSLYIEDIHQSGLSRLLSIFLLGLLLLCLLLFFIAFVVLRHFLKKVTVSLNGISENISDFVDSIDSKNKS